MGINFHFTISVGYAWNSYIIYWILVVINNKLAKMSLKQVVHQIYCNITLDWTRIQYRLLKFVTISYENTIWCTVFESFAIIYGKKDGISHDKIRLVENQKRIVYSKQIHKGKLGANLRFNQYLAKPNIMNYPIWST